MVHSIFGNLLKLKVYIIHFKINFNYFLFFRDPQKFALYDTNRDGLVDAPEFARGEAITEHQCKLIILSIFFEKTTRIFFLIVGF